MEKKIGSTIGLALGALMLLVLTACGAGGQQSASQEVPAASAMTGRSETGALPVVQLALGTFKLEKTDYPISAQQAGELLLLWKAARSLNNSETSAAEEVKAVMAQIQTTMTSKQIQAISDMQLSSQDMGEISQEMGLDLGAGDWNMSPGMQASAQAVGVGVQMPGGQMPEGPMPGGDIPAGGPGGGAELDPAALETTMAGRVDASGMNLGVNSTLLDAVIEFLSAKTQE